MIYEQGKFKASFTVNSHDADRNGNVRPSVMLRYVHEAANLQLESGHPTMDELRYDMKKAFLLSRVTMEMKRPLHGFEAIDVLTWGAGGRGASFYRSGKIYAGEEDVASLVSVWALLDLETGRLCRVRDVALGIPIVEELPLETPSHIRPPEGVTLEEVGTRTVYNSDIDVNTHMNNTNYPDMLTNYIPGIENKWVSSFSIGYLHEAPLGETLTVLYGRDGNTHYLRTLLADGKVNAEAMMVTEDVG